MISKEKYTTEELNARLKFFIGIVLGLTLFGIVFVVLYSLIFVTQPMNGMSPVDNKFFELIIPIATFLTGTLSGIMLAGDDKELRAKALESANRAPTPPAGGGLVARSAIPGTGGFSAAANIGGFNMSYNKPSVSPAGNPARVEPSSQATPAMSSTGKPMPIQEEGEEL